MSINELLSLVLSAFTIIDAAEMQVALSVINNDNHRHCSILIGLLSPYVPEPIEGIPCFLFAFSLTV